MVPAREAASSASPSACFTVPLTTYTRQGWMFAPLGAEAASSRMASTSSRATGCCLNARTARRERMTVDTHCATASWARSRTELSIAYSFGAAW